MAITNNTESIEEQETRRFVGIMKQWYNHWGLWVSQLEDVATPINQTELHGWYGKVLADSLEAQAFLALHNDYFLANFATDHAWLTEFLARVDEVLSRIVVYLDGKLGSVSVSDLQALAPSITVQQILNNLPALTWGPPSKTILIDPIDRTVLADYIKARKI